MKYAQTIRYERAEEMAAWHVESGKGGDRKAFPLASKRNREGQVVQWGVEGALPSI